MLRRAAAVETGPDTSLTERAHSFAPAPDAVQSRYFWRDENTLLLIEHTRDRTWNISLRDRKTGLTAPLNLLTAAYQNSAAHRAMVVGSPSGTGGIDANPERLDLPATSSIAPNGTMLLWAGRDTHWYLYSLSGELKGRWPRGGDHQTSEDPAWSRDSSQWVEAAEVMTNGVWRVPRLVVHDVELPGVQQVIPVSGLPDGLMLGISASGHVMLLDAPAGRSAASDHAMLLLAEWHGAATRAVGLPVALPARCRVSEAALSPQGTRLAWVLKNGSSCGLWLSDAMGRGMKHIGSAPMVPYRDPSSRSVRYTWPVNIRWLPRGSSLSFSYRGRLWVIPAV
ncbi:MAG: hypothetical protein KGJ62_03290 [Armatimonadetes bacterium]|nr:hypothetical protein [Armatimonadota bacterium]MDE2205742.1 hypothetical protein [Armatimonadota bacterium]